MSFRVLVADPLANAGLEVLRAEREIELIARPGMKPDELRSELELADARIVRSETKVTTDLLEHAPGLRVIGRAGVGLDNVDVEAATRRGIAVMNTPGGNTRSTAEHTFAMMLSLARNIPQANAALREGRWERKSFSGVELRGKTLGIIGFGRVGSELLKLARGAEMEVLAFDPYTRAERIEELGAEPASLDDLLARADVVSVHTPLTEDTRGLLDAERLAKMKPDALVVNCARGGIVDEAALLAALEEGKLGGAAIDVFEKEPTDNAALVNHPRVVATPHLGASTGEAQTGVAVGIARQVVDALLGRGYANAVNMAQVDPSQRKLLQPYLAMAERMGLFAVQMLERPPLAMELTCEGELADVDPHPLVVAALKGVLTPAHGDSVNYVNAALLAREKGLPHSVRRGLGQSGYSALLSLTLTAQGGKVELSGSVFGANLLRLVSVNGYRLEMTPAGHLVVVRNEDRPGAVGRIGSILGEAGVNIADMSLGRKARGTTALCVVHCDEPLDRSTRDALLALPEVVSVKSIELP